MDLFQVPVVLFSFKRIDKTLLIVERLSKVKPQKLYIISDGGRTDEEWDKVNKCRSEIEAHIDWNCEVVKRYASCNIGVYANIAGGVKWVFEQEEYAIFLEDDNLPALSFFPFCQEMLLKYKDDTRVLWICGTNYLKSFSFPSDSSYYFTHHMMPCGWASWSDKFNRFYDKDFSLWENPYIQEVLKNLPYDNLLRAQDIENWNRELKRKKKGLKFDSWDYQMSFSLRVHGLYGIVPKYNQITNIGVDFDSIHGGSSFDNIMTRRFCGLPTQELEFPLKHPLAVQADSEYEKATAHIITMPLSYRLKSKISNFLKRLFRIDMEESFTKTMHKRFFRL